MDDHIKRTNGAGIVDQLSANGDISRPSVENYDAHS